MTVDNCPVNRHLHGAISILRRFQGVKSSSVPHSFYILSVGVFIFYLHIANYFKMSGLNKLVPHHGVYESGIGEQHGWVVLAVKNESEKKKEKESTAGYLNPVYPLG